MKLCLAVTLLVAAVSCEGVLAADPLVGRVNHAGYNRHAHCTGFIVEGGHLVTAAHCMPRAERTVHFLAGFDRGGFGDHVQASTSRFRKLKGRDIVVLCNAAASNSGLAVTVERPIPTQSVTIRGYASPRSQILQSRQCDVIRASSNGRIEIGCPLAPGTSGAPATVTVDGIDHVIGVVSATSLSTAIIHALEPKTLEQCR